MIFEFFTVAIYKVEVEQEGYLLSGLQFMFWNVLTFLIFKLHASQLFSRRGQKLKFQDSVDNYVCAPEMSSYYIQNQRSSKKVFAIAIKFVKKYKIDAYL